MRHMYRWSSLLLLMLLVACGGTPTTTSTSTIVPPTTGAEATSAIPTEAPTTSSEVPTTAAMTEVATEAAPTATNEPPTEVATTAATTVATEAATTAATAVATEAAATASSGTATGEMNVFAAASLTESFQELGKTFEAANSGAKVTFNFAGSQQLVQQITQGAPADVFAAANAKTMSDAIAAGDVVSGTQRTFVRNRLVVVYPKDNPGGIHELKDLAKPGLKLDLAAKEVPVGQYSLDVLDKASKDEAIGATFKDDVLKNVVSYEENVKVVLSKVALGEADAGIVYTTDITQNVADKIGRIDIPDPLNTIASYPIAAIKGSKNADLAAKFVAFILSPDAQQVLAKYGFIPTTGSASGATPSAEPLAISGLVTTPQTLTVADLRKMEQVSVKATDRDGIEQTYTGVAIATLLKNATLQPAAKQVVFTGGDGYAQMLRISDLQADTNALISIDENGALRNILPTQPPKFWIKGLIKIDVQ